MDKMTSLGSGYYAYEQRQILKAMQNESVTERAKWSVDLAVADLILAVTECQSTDEAVQLSQFIQPLILKLEAAESAARHKADQLSGANR